MQNSESTEKRRDLTLPLIYVIAFLVTGPFGPSAMYGWHIAKHRPKAALSVPLAVLLIALIFWAEPHVGYRLGDGWTLVLLLWVSIGIPMAIGILAKYCWTGGVEKVWWKIRGPKGV